MEESEDEVIQDRDLSCTFCGPGTWSLWEVVTEDGVFFVCDRHHVEMSQANIIEFEKRVGQKTWSDFEDLNGYE